MSELNQASAQMSAEECKSRASLARKLIRKGDAEAFDRAADTIEALQQRCEELEDQVKTMTDVSEIYSEDWNAALGRIAALEGALKAMLTFYGINERRGEASEAIHNRARQALSGRQSEGGNREVGDG